MPSDKCTCGHLQIVHINGDGYCTEPSCPCMGFKTWEDAPTLKPIFRGALFSPEPPPAPPIVCVILDTDEDYAERNLYIWADGSRACFYQGKWEILPPIDYHAIFNPPEEIDF